MKGQCLCGSVRYEAQPDPSTAYYCHCRDCQIGSGSAFHVAVLAPEESFRHLSGRTSEWSKIADSGNLITRVFCPACGTPVWWTGEGFPGVVVLTLSSLDEPDATFMRKKAWATLTEGAHISVFNDALSQRAVLENENTANGMYWVGLVRRFVEQLNVNLGGMQPADNLVSGEAWAIAREGEEYIVYLPSGGGTGIVGLPTGHVAQWYNPRNGDIDAADPGPFFTAPDTYDWVLHVKAN